MKNSGFLSTLPEGQFDNRLESVREGASAPSDYGVLTIMARWLSWLERRPVTAEVVGSIPIRVAKFYSCRGVLAQLGEHLPYKQRVIGSSPIGPIPM